jgi:Fe-S cluster biogenesis protein NfuA
VSVRTMPESPADLVVKACREHVTSLVHADGGEIYLVAATLDDVHIHLAGTCSGCPGATMTRDRLLAPALKAALPKAQLRVTTGWRAPRGAVKID